MSDNDLAAIRPTLLDRVTGRHRRALDDLHAAAIDAANRRELEAQARYESEKAAREAADARAEAQREAAQKARAQIRHLGSQQVAEAREAQVKAVKAALGDFVPGKLYREQPEGVDRFGLLPLDVASVERPRAAVEMRRREGRSYGTPGYIEGVTLRAREAPKVPDVADLGPEPQGTVGTPRNGDLYDVETRDELQPWGMRGLGFDHGEMQRFHRGDPAVKDAVSRRTAIGVGATWEWHVPDIDPDLAARVGIDLDAAQRMRDELNAEFVLNQSINPTQLRSQQVRGTQVCGFDLQEFGLRLPTGEYLPRIGERIAFVEPREQSSIQGWVVNAGGRAIAATQQDPNGSGRGTSMPVIDLRRCLHSVNEMDGANAEGVPELRSPWTYHTVAAEFIQSALLHRKRFGGGIPIVKRIASDEMDADTVAAIRTALAQYSNHQEAYIAALDGIDVDILPPVSDGQLIDVLEFCVAQKRQALGASMFDLGTNGVGSLALASVQGEFYLKILNGFFWQVASSYRTLTRAYCDAYFPAENGHLLYPELRITGFATRTPAEVIELHTGLASLRGAGASEAQIEDAAEAVDVVYRAPGSLASEAQAEADAGNQQDTASEQPILPGVAIDASGRIAEQLGAGTITPAFAKAQLVAAGYLPATAAEMVASMERTAPHVEPAQDTAPNADAIEHIEPVTRAAQHACGPDCDHSVRTYARRPRIASTTRGGEFVTFRALTPSEERVNLPGLEAEILGAEERIREALLRVQSEHRSAFVETARPLFEARPPRTDEVAVLNVDFVPEYTAAIWAVLDELGAWVAEDMQAEIREALGLPADAPIPSSAQVSDTAASPQAQRAAAVDLLARRANDRANERFRSLGVQVASGAPKSILTTSAGIAGSAGLGHTTDLMVSQAVSTTVNTTRDQVAEEGPRVMRATYSAVMDRMTCAECRSMDGRQFRYPSQAYEAAKPPNPRCHGVTSTQGLANPCRCVMVYDWEPLSGPVTEDGEGAPLASLRRRAPEHGIATRATLVVGPPGSGKSTFARSLGNIVLDKDAWMFADDQRTGLTSAQAWEALTDAAGTIPGRVVIVAPLTTSSARAKAIADLAERDIVVDGICAPSLDAVAMACSRNAKRPEWRQVPDHVVQASIMGWESPADDEADEVMRWGCDGEDVTTRAADVDLTPTETMAEEAERGLQWRREHERGGTAVGVARARDIANRRGLSEDTVRRMVAYFARHEVDRQAEGWSPGEDGYPSAGRIAWALWGGDAGRAWAEERVRVLDGE